MDIELKTAILSSMPAENPRLPDLPTIAEAKLWNNPNLLLRIEMERYPFQRALSEIVGSVFSDYIPENVASLFEVGAGEAFLRELIPTRYHNKLIHSEYSESGILEGKQRRGLSAAVAASATELPLADATVDGIVGLDVYGTLPNLPQAMREAKRALKSGGTLIHFQANTSDRTAWLDHPDRVFYPTGLGHPKNPALVGIKRDDLINGLDAVPSPIMRGVLGEFLSDPLGAYTDFLQLPIRDQLSDRVLKVLQLIPGDKLTIASSHDYLSEKLQRIAKESGLQVIEAKHREKGLIALRSDSQQPYPTHNTFEMLYGAQSSSKNMLLQRQHSHVVVERANMLVFVAKKP